VVITFTSIAARQAFYEARDKLPGSSGIKVVADKTSRQRAINRYFGDKARQAKTEGKKVEWIAGKLHIDDTKPALPADFF
jgi:hypothetical protein